MAAGKGFGPECEVVRVHGYTVRVPAAPLPCSYVRILDAGRREIAYWDAAEWAEDPAGVMGAIMGAIRAVSLGERVDL